MQNKISFSLLDCNLSGSALKVIAVLSMLSDHCAYFFMEQGTWIYEAMRSFGRIAFPVFAFLIAEGFSHTRNRQRYLLTLLAFAIISEVPWLLLCGYGGGHNVMFTLALGVLALQVLDKLPTRKVLAFSIIALIGFVAERYNLDYGWRGIWMITIFYLFQQRGQFLNSEDGSINYKWLQFYDLFPILQVLFTFPLMMHYGTFGAVLAVSVILLYNGERGFIKGNIAKYDFYAFYPIHLFVIWLFTRI